MSRFSRQALFATAFAIVVAPAAVRAEVVFGNLGSTGTNGLSSTNTDIGPGAATTLALAQGFTTGGGSTSLLVQSITIGAFVDGVANRTVSIYSSVGNAPGSALYTSSATSVSGQAKYVFNFSGALLGAGTSYWVVPDFSVDWSWYLESTESTQPSGQNSSGYSYLGTQRQTQASPGTWVATALPYSVSIDAVTVPEPSTYALAAVGLGIAGMARARRRKGAV